MAKAEARSCAIILPVDAIVAFHFAVQWILDGVYVITGITPPQTWIAEATAATNADDKTDKPADDKKDGDA